MIIVKIGGGENINISGVIADLAKLDEKFIVVHGANALRDELAQKLNYEKKILTSVSGYQSVYSDDEALDSMMMAYSGLRNKRIVEEFQKNGVNAVGITGLDGKTIQGKRNKGIRVRENGKLKMLRDFSGKPKSVNTDLINLLLDNNYTPVLTMPIIDETGYAINSENDDVVAVLQKELKAGKVIQLIEATGFLENSKDDSSVIHKITKAELEAKEQQVEGRMKRKVLALRNLFESSDTTVYISDGRTEHPIEDALNGKGTVIE